MTGPQSSDGGEALTFVVYGKPRPKGSMESVGPRGRGGMKESNAESAPWRSNVTWSAIRTITEVEQATGQRWVPLDCPVVVDVLFCFARPKGAAKSVVYPTTRSTYDLDKLQRNVGDALTDAQVVVDDARIVKWVALKAFCGPSLPHLNTPGAVIDVRPYLPAVGNVA